MARTDTDTTPTSRSGALAIGIGVVIALVVICLMLYSPMSDFYAAWRDNLRLQESYNKTVDEYTELQGDVDALRTVEGIKDEARRQGLVEEGETRVVVENLPKDTTTADTAPEEPEPDPWYLQALDTIFGYEA